MHTRPPNLGPKHIPSVLTAIYNEYRTVLLNSKYNSASLDWYTKVNRYSEIGIAIGGCGSIASFTLWRATELGQNVWVSISNLAALLVVIKPFFNYGEKIKEYTRLSEEYAIISVHYKDIINNIQSLRFLILETGTLPEEIDSRLIDIRKKIADLTPLGDQRSSKRFVRKLQGEVNREVPATSLWLPEG